ncbi:unnamed protein product [Lupinus luteus]|uniref:Pentatricopeptide repeat-containing protein n=1 Tax=Lupinus luteus TaxID=3873 RepID=A0AAV1WPU5_LUPLU
MPYRDVAFFNAMIHGYVKLGCMELAKDLFDQMVDKNVISWISMISGYCQNGGVDSARLMFDVTNEKTVFTWNAMIGGYCHNKRSHEALRLFRKMQLSASMEPNEIIVSSILLVIAYLGALDLEGEIRRTGNVMVMQIKGSRSRETENGEFIFSALSHLVFFVIPL